MLPLASERPFISRRPSESKMVNRTRQEAVMVGVMPPDDGLGAMEIPPDGAGDGMGIGVGSGGGAGSV